MFLDSRKITGKKTTKDDAAHASPASNVPQIMDMLGHFPSSPAMVRLLLEHGVDLSFWCRTPRPMVELDVRERVLAMCNIGFGYPFNAESIKGYSSEE